MDYFIKNELPELKYEQGKGAWTYYIQIHKNISSGNGNFLKASGAIDGFQMEYKIRFTIKGQNKLLSVNSEIRKAINKSVAIL